MRIQNRLALTLTLVALLAQSLTILPATAVETPAKTMTRSVEVMRDTAASNVRGVRDASRAVTVGSEKQFLDSGNAKYDKGEYQAAIEDYDKVLQINPKNSDAWASRAGCKQLLKDYLGGIADANEGIKVDPGYYWLYYVKGKCYMGLNDYKKAMTEFDKAINLRSNDKWVTFWHGKAAYYLKDYSTALSDMNKAANIDEKYWDAYNFRYWIYSAIKDLDSAKEECLTMIKLQPTWADSHLCYAYVLEDTKNYTGAIAEYKKAAELFATEKNPTWADKANGYATALINLSNQSATKK